MGILQWMNDTSLAESIRDSIWLFPVFETIHVAAIVLVVGSIARLDLRLAGGLSLAFWISVVICGRFIGFV